MYNVPFLGVKSCKVEQKVDILTHGLLGSLEGRVVGFGTVHHRLEPSQYAFVNVAIPVLEPLPDLLTRVGIRDVNLSGFRLLPFDGEQGANFVA